MEAVAIDVRRVPIGHALHADGVEVPAEQKRAPTAAAAGAHDDARAPRGLLVDLGFEAGAPGPARHVRGNLGLAGGARLERGVDGVDRDERAGQLDDVRGAHCGLTLAESGTDIRKRGCLSFLFHSPQNLRHPSSLTARGAPAGYECSLIARR